jgi:hypothetical protein
MSQLHDQLCPWCQTEIVWDPEIGPEKTCPHCLNELNDYRSLKLTVKQTGQDLLMDDDEDDDYREDEDEDDEIEGFDDYEEGVQRVLDTQEEAPECSTCHCFMLYTGNRTMALGFVPYVPVLLKQPLLQASHASKVFVCPNCFKIEQVVADEDRMAMIELLKQHGKK